MASNFKVPQSFRFRKFRNKRASEGSSTSDSRTESSPTRILPDLNNAAVNHTANQTEVRAEPFKSAFGITKASSAGPHSGEDIGESTVDQRNDALKHTPLKFSDLQYVDIPSADPILPSGDVQTKTENQDSMLWEKAYVQVQQSEPEIVKRYEMLLARYNPPMSGSEPKTVEPAVTDNDSIFSDYMNLRDHRKRMERILYAFFPGGDPAGRMEVDLQDLSDMRSFHTYLGSIAPAALSSPHSVIAWVGVIFAFKAIVGISPPPKASVSELNYILSSLKWYEGLSTFPLIRNDGEVNTLPSPSSGAIYERTSRALVELYQALLMQLVHLACYAPEENLSPPSAKYDFQKHMFEKERVVKQAFDSYDVGAKFCKLMSPSDQQPDSERATGGSGSGSDDDDDWDNIDELPNNRLRDAAYDWVLMTPEYQKFRNSTERGSQVLQVSGRPGVGKSLLIASILRHWNDPSATRRTLSSRRNVFSYFPRDSNTEPGNAASVIWHLIRQIITLQPLLLKHMSRVIESTGREQLDRRIDFNAVSGILYSMLQDDNFKSPYFIIDAIDECCNDGNQKEGEQGMRDLLDLVSITLKMSTKVKWLISMDSSSFDAEPAMREMRLRAVRLNLDSSLDSQSPISIIHASAKADQLMQGTRADVKFRNLVTEKLQERSGGNLLWMNLACKIIQSLESPWNSLSILDEIPTGLNELYRYAYQSLEILPQMGGQHCCDILYETACAYRPLRISQLEDITSVPPNVNLRLIVKKCSSFLDIDEDMVFCIHHSGKNFLRENKDLHQKTHATMARRCLDFLASSFDNKPDVKATEREDKLTNVEPDEVRKVHYATLYWMKHLSEISEASEDQDHYKLLSSFMNFFNNYFLQWLETLTSPLGLSYLIRQIADLDELFTTKLRHASDAPHCSQLVRHASEFLRLHQTMKSPVPGPKITNTLFFGPGNGHLRHALLSREFPWLVSMPHGDQGNSLSLEAHTDWVRCCAYSSDGRLVASCSDDKTVRIWDSQSGERQKTLEGFQEWVYKVMFSSNGLIATMEETVIKIWDSATLQLVHALTVSDIFSDPPSDNPSDMAFFPNENKLVIAAANRVAVWDTVSHKVSATWELQARVRRLSVSKNGLLAGSTQFVEDSTRLNRITVMDSNNGDILHQLEVLVDEIDAVCFSPDSQWLASDSDDGKVRVWATNSFSATARIFEHGKNGYSAISFSHDSSRIAAAYSDKSIAIWELDGSGHPERKLLGHGGKITSIQFSPMDDTLISSASDKNVRIWYTSSQSDLVTTDGSEERHAQSVSIVMTSLDKKLIASGDPDGVICLWDGDTGHYLLTLRGHEGILLHLFFSPDGQNLGTTSTDGVVRVWNIASNTQTHSFKGHFDWVRCAAFLPDGRTVVSGSDDCTIRIWNLTATSEDNSKHHILKVRKLEGHSDYVRCVACSPDGQYLVSGGDNSSLLLWDLKSPTHATTPEFSESTSDPDADSESCIRLFKTSDDVSAVTFNSGSEKIVSCSVAGQITVWNTETAEPLQIIQTSVYFDTLRCDPNHPNWVLTEHGAWPIGGNALRPDSSGPPPWSPWRMSSERDWITWEDKEVIFIPQRHRPMDTGFFVLDDRVVIGSKSGGVLLFRFAKDCNPTLGLRSGSKILYWSTDSNSQKQNQVPHVVVS